jgi:hypothetical protein
MEASLQVAVCPNHTKRRKLMQILLHLFITLFSVLLTAVSLSNGNLFCFTLIKLLGQAARMDKQIQGRGHD